MPDPNPFAFQFGKTPAMQPRDPEQPLRILVLGNFSGSQSSALSSQLAERKIQRVDIDNFEKLLKQTSPIVQIPLNNRSDLSNAIEIKELDDFHPDNLYNKLPVFNELRELRLQLSNPRTFSQAAAKLQAALPQPQMETGQAPTAQSERTPPTESNANVLQRLLGQSANTNELPAGSALHHGIDRFINEVVAPFVLPGKDSRQEEFLKYLDTAVASQMRNILHHSDFQSLEATWRGLHFLVSNVAMNEELQVFTLNVTKAELLQAIATDSGHLEDSLLFRRLVTEREEMPWSLLVGDFSFGQQTEELILLGSLGAIAARSGGPFIASAAPGLLGYGAWTDELQTPGSVAETGTESDAWQALRSLPVAPWIGLTAPRFLLRLPYGASHDPIEAFPFEEIEDPQGQHDAFLCGSSSLLCATLIATSYLESRWELTLGDHLEIDDLPAFTFAVDGQMQLKPCSEAYLSERLADLFLARGVMPLLSFKNRNAVRLRRFQSIADPTSPLAGPWS